MSRINYSHTINPSTLTFAYFPTENPLFLQAPFEAVARLFHSTFSHKAALTRQNHSHLILPDPLPLISTPDLIHIRWTGIDIDNPQEALDQLDSFIAGFHTQIKPNIRGRRFAAIAASHNQIDALVGNLVWFNDHRARLNDPATQRETRASLIKDFPLYSSDINDISVSSSNLSY